MSNSPLVPDNSSQNLNKTDLRNLINKQRLALSSQQKSKKSRELLKIVTSLIPFRQSQRIAFYWPLHGEIDPIPILNLALKLGKRCYLPILHPIQNNQLLFVEYRLGDQLISNRYGIKEPRLGQRDLLSPWLLNLVFVPLMGFNLSGHRLGRGGGYYDRTFAFLKNQSRFANPILIGLAYDFQKIDSLPYENWDVTLAGVATETSFLQFKPSV